MTVGDFPALGYNGNWQTFCPHGTLPGTYCALCGVGAYWLPAGPAVVSQGWQCPVCSHVMAPVMTVCPYCPSSPPLVTMTTTGSIGVSTTADTAAATPEPAVAQAEGALAVFLPDYMRDGGVQCSPVTKAWREIFPGLEAKAGRIETTELNGSMISTVVDVHFRLTPDNGQQHG
jgi:hypothetical protein